MRKVTWIFGISLLVLITCVGWQIASWELAGIELRDDLQDLASETGVYTGLAAPKSDEELRQAVIRKAKQYHIELTPDQITLSRTQLREKSIVHLSATYSVPLNLLIASPRLQFTESNQPHKSH